MLTITHTRLEKSFVADVLRCDNRYSSYSLRFFLLFELFLENILSLSLSLSSSELEKITAEKGWQLNESTITFPVNDYNQPKQKAQKKQLRFAGFYSLNFPLLFYPSFVSSFLSFLPTHIPLQKSPRSSKLFKRICAIPIDASNQTHQPNSALY